MYQIGDLVVYGNEGVCRVDAIGVLDIPSIDKDQLYYTLSPLYRDGKVFTPVDTTVLMRTTITRDEAQDLIGRIPAMPVDTCLCGKQDLKTMNEHYQAALQSCDGANLLQLIKTVHTKWQIVTQSGRKLGQVDERYLKRAEELLYGEFAVALGNAKEDVKQVIENAVKKLEMEEQASEYRA